MKTKNIKNIIRKILEEENSKKYDFVTDKFIEKTAKRAGIDISKYDIIELIKGYKIELEHGKADPETNVTNDDPVKTLKITIRHLKEISDYNTRLSDMEKKAKDELGKEVMLERAVSKSQQRYMGQVHALQTGQLSPKDINPKFRKQIVKTAKTINPGEAEKFAKTKAKNLPEKIKEKSETQKKHKLVLEKNDALNDNKKIDLIKKFISLCCKNLDIKKPIKIILTTKRGGSIKTTASFNPNNNDIYIYTKLRHVIDICGSIAHEIKHLHQNLQNILTNTSGDDGSEHENEAHIFSGLMKRKFGKKFPEVYE